MNKSANVPVFQPGRMLAAGGQPRIQAEVIIIGAGPAGLAAGIQLKRYGITPLILEKDGGGGLLRNANLVENYPGFPGGISGSELVRLFLQQARQIGVEITQAEAANLFWTGVKFCVETAAHQYFSPLVVIASGTAPRKFTGLALPGELSQRVYYDVHKLAESVGANIAIVGAGDAAFDYALNLARQNRVILLNRGEEVRCLPLLVERAAACSKITYRRSIKVLGLEPLPGGSMKLMCLGPGGEEQMEVDYLIGALGREPQMNFLPGDFLQQAQELEKQGKLYWIGDVSNGRCRQASIAVGDGVRAAMQIYQYQERMV